MKIKCTFFGKTKIVNAVPYNMEPDEDYDEVLWAERAEDWYALLSSQLSNKKVAVVRGDAWLKGEEVNE